jgi:glycosidase
MGEDLEVPGRLAVRTPMQWTSEANGGFSRAQRRRLVRPVVDGGFGPEHVNVADQRTDPDSMLEFVSLLIRRYRECPELGWADFEVIDQPHAAVLAHRCTWDDASMVAVHNLSPEAVEVPLTVDGCGDEHQLMDLLQDGGIRPDAKGRVDVRLDGYGYRWLRVVEPGSRRLV